DTALHHAAYQGDLSMVQRILNIGDRSDIDFVDSTGTTALYVACDRQQTAIVSFLWGNGAELTYVCPLGDSPLHRLCLRGSGALLADILESDVTVDVDVADKGGRTPLHVAASMGYVDVCSALVTLGSCAVNKQDLEQKTAIHLACEDGHFNVVVLLVDHYADLTIRDEVGATPFLYAVMSGKIRLCKYLKGRGVDIHTCTSSGNTALHIA
ncbi:unnamed protein product, partial [Ectocarpus fasciculatus]